MYKSIRWRVVLFLVSLSSPFTLTALQAKANNDLYFARVAVEGKSAQSRTEAYQAALQLVLIKLTGSTSIIGDRRISSIISNVDQYVKHYTYRTIDTQKLTSALANHYIDVYFTPSKLNRRINDLGFPVWSGERPRTILWLAVKDGNQHFILSNARTKTNKSANDVRSALDRATQKFALPIVLPLMDGQDQSAISLFDIRNNFTAQIQQASNRYGLKTALVGELIRSSNTWYARWILYLEDSVYRWQSSVPTLGAAIDVGMARLANQLTTEYSILIDYSQETLLKLSVTKLVSLDDYATVLNYLNGLSVTENVYLDRLSDSASYFTVKILGDRDNFHKIISKDNVLVADTAPLTDDANEPSATLYYQLHP